MIIGVTGASSDIGQAVAAQLAAAGHTPVRLVRTPSAATDRFYDLHEPVSAQVIDGLDALIHLAWDWDAAGDPLWDANSRAGRELARMCGQRGVRPVLLSTFSVFAGARSLYGTSKLVVEREFVGVGGACVRAGLVWGGEQSAGIVDTVRKLASVPLVTALLYPDPVMYHSHRNSLAEQLSRVATASAQPAPLSLAVSSETVRLGEMVVNLAPQGRMRVAVPSAWLVAAGEVAGRVRLPVPYRVDSLRAATAEAQIAVERSGLPFLGQFPGRAPFLEWLTRVGSTES